MTRKKGCQGGCIKARSRYKTQNSFQNDCHLFRYLFSLHSRQRKVVWKRKKIRTKETDENRDVSGDHDVTLPRRSLSLLPPCVTYFLFFTLRVTHCRVESKFLTLKISCKGTTKLLETDGGTEVDRIEGSMTQRIEKIERERESKGREVAKCGANKREEKKKSQAERKDYIGDFGFRVSSGPKPISRFSVFPPARTATRIRCPLYERWNETRLILRPDFVTSHIKSRSTL